MVGKWRWLAVIILVKGKMCHFDIPVHLLVYVRRVLQAVKFVLDAAFVNFYVNCSLLCVFVHRALTLVGMFHFVCVLLTAYTVDYI